MTVDGLYWDEAGRADVGMIEPGDTVYCICRGADGLFSVSSGVCVDPPVRFIDFGDGAQFLGVASTVEPSALRRFGGFELGAPLSPYTLLIAAQPS